MVRRCVGGPDVVAGEVDDSSCLRRTGVADDELPALPMFDDIARPGLEAWFKCPAPAQSVTQPTRTAWPTWTTASCVAPSPSPEPLSVLLHPRGAAPASAEPGDATNVIA